MEIYFAGSIRAGRNDAELYLKIIEYLKIYGQVSTEHIGNVHLTSLGEKGISDELIYNRDMGWLLNSKVIVAEVLTPSLGVGYEIGRALKKGKNILCLFRKEEGKKLSAMIGGCRDIICQEYTDFSSLKK